MTSVRTEHVAPEVVADYAADGALIGVEFSTPRHISGDTTAAVDRVLGAAGTAGPPVREELAPLAVTA